MKLFIKKITLSSKKEDLSGNESSSGGTEKSIKECGIPVYCINDRILIRNNEIVSLS